VKHRDVDYTVRELGPRRWHWHIFPPGQASPIVTSDHNFSSRERAVEACLGEINNCLTRIALRSKGGQSCFEKGL
jgi:hypothetical protein